MEKRLAKLNKAVIILGIISILMLLFRLWPIFFIALVLFIGARIWCCILRAKLPKEPDVKSRLVKRRSSRALSAALIIYKRRTIMKLNYELVGTLNITADEIDITDPSYDKDVWCRTRKPITPGEYNCYVGIGSNKNWGTRVYMLILLATDVDLDSKGDVENVGTIGVDAGMAMFS